MKLTQAEYSAMAGAVALQDATLEDQHNRRERRTLDSAWRKIQDDTRAASSEPAETPGPDEYAAACVHVDEAFGQMPYGGSAHFVHLWQPRRGGRPAERVPEPTVALEIIDGNLRRLAEILRRVTTSNEADRARLMTLDRLLAGAADLGLQMVALAEAASHDETPVAAQNIVP